MSVISKILNTYTQEIAHSTGTNIAVKSNPQVSTSGVDGYANTARNAMIARSFTNGSINPFGAATQARRTIEKPIVVCGIVGTHEVLVRLEECDPSIESLRAALAVVA